MNTKESNFKIDEVCCKRFYHFALDTDVYKCDGQWISKVIGYLEYCPFCGKKLNNKKKEGEE